MILYLLFLWHWIPNADGGLSGYCERKINGRLSKIVSVKVNKALEEEERKRNRADAKAAKKGEKPQFGRQATLPTLFDAKSDDKLPKMPMLNHNDTMTTLPVYSSRPGTPSGQPTLPALELDELSRRRPLPSRSVTGSSAMSNMSVTSNAPLLGNASDMGYGRPASPAPSLPPLDTHGFPSAPNRTMNANSFNSQRNRGAPGGPLRMPSAMGDRGYTQSPVSYTDDSQSPSSATDPHGRTIPRAGGEFGSNTFNGAPSTGRRTPFDPNYHAGPPSPAPGTASDYGRNSPGLSSRGAHSPTAGGVYQPYNSRNAPSNVRSASTAPFPNPAFVPQYRNMTDPGSRGPHPGGDYFTGGPTPMPQRPGTAQSGRITPKSSRLGLGGGEEPGGMVDSAPHQGRQRSPTYGPGQGLYGR